MDPLLHAQLAVDHLPARPAALSRSDLPLLLDAVRGQMRQREGYQREIVAALAEGDREALGALIELGGEMRAAFELLSPYRHAAEAMAANTRAPALTRRY